MYLGFTAIRMLICLCYGIYSVCGDCELKTFKDTSFHSIVTKVLINISQTSCYNTCFHTNQRECFSISYDYNKATCLLSGYEFQRIMGHVYRRYGSDVIARVCYKPHDDKMAHQKGNAECGYRRFSSVAMWDDISQVLRGVNVSQCASSCRDNSFCNSFNYLKLGNTCFHLTNTLEEGITSVHFNAMFDLYIRSCSDNKQNEDDMITESGFEDDVTPPPIGNDYDSNVFDFDDSGSGMDDKLHDIRNRTGKGDSNDDFSGDEMNDLSGKTGSGFIGDDVNDSSGDEGSGFSGDAIYESSGIYSGDVDLGGDYSGDIDYSGYFSGEADVDIYGGALSDIFGENN